MKNKIVIAGITVALLLIATNALAAARERVNPTIPVEPIVIIIDPPGDTPKVPVGWTKAMVHQQSHKKGIKELPNEMLLAPREGRPGKMVLRPGDVVTDNKPQGNAYGYYGLVGTKAKGPKVK